MRVRVSENARESEIGKWRHLQGEMVGDGVGISSGLSSLPWMGWNLICYVNGYGNECNKPMFECP